uniref:Nonstructural protein n=1 Tax=Dulem virus 128 TaxID=3145605 RepID=A0AAU8B4A4_9VIRU
MKYGIYTVRDFKVGFMSPVADSNDASAMRGFEHSVLHSDINFITSHPEDYALFKIGEYDSDSGVITPIFPIVELLTATQVVDAATARFNAMEGSEKKCK